MLLVPLPVVTVGLLGHSDADVLTHAIMDAMLGALSLGDIGHYFPPTDPQWQGANSLKLLEQVNQLNALFGYFMQFYAYFSHFCPLKNYLGQSGEII